MMRDPKVGQNKLKKYNFISILTLDCLLAV